MIWRAIILGAVHFVKPGLNFLHHLLRAFPSCDTPFSIRHGLPEPRIKFHLLFQLRNQSLIAGLDGTVLRLGDSRCTTTNQEGMYRARESSLEEQPN